MAVPTVTAIRSTVVDWWREPGVPSLSVLQVRLAKLFTDTRAIIGHPRIEERTPGIYTLVIELIRDSLIVRSLEWTPTSSDRQETLLDVFDQSIGMTWRRRHELTAGESTP